MESTELNKENLLKGTTILGDLDSKITIVEFGDYQCTFCYKFHRDTMNQIKEKYVDSQIVNFAYKDFPLNGDASRMASEASYCAQKQDKFWEYHNTIYDNWEGENTGWITLQALLKFAQDSELNIEEFDLCMNKSEFRQKVENNEAFARSINVDATPSFLIFNDKNVYRIIGAQPFEKFEKIIQELETSGK